MAKNKALVFAAITVLFLGFPSGLSAQAEANSNPIVLGVADFMVDRINANYTFVMQERFLAHAEFLKDYLPNTIEMLRQSSLWTLGTNKEMWQTLLKRDLERLAKNIQEKAAGMVTESLIKAYQLSGEEAADAREKLLAFFQELFSSKEPGLMNFAKLTLPEALAPIKKELIDKASALQWMEFYKIWEKVNLPKSVFEFNETLQSIIDRVPSATTVNKTQQTAIDVLKDEKLLTQLSNNLTKDLKKAGEATTRAAFAEAIKAIDKLGAAVRMIEAFDEFLATYSLSPAVTPKIFASIRFIKAVGPELFDAKLTEPNLKILTDLLYLCAGLAEATAADQVKAVLINAALPPVSYKVKKTDRPIFLIGSSFEATYAPAAGQPATFETAQWGFPVRLDVELVAPLWDVPFALTFSPVDLTRPVLNKALDRADDYQWSDLVSPAVGLSIAWPNLPIRVSVSYVYKSRPNFWESLEYGVGLDMPVLTLLAF